MQRLAVAADAVCMDSGPRSDGAGSAAPLVLLAGDFNTTPDAAACRVCSAQWWRMLPSSLGGVNGMCCAAGVCGLRLNYS